MTKVTGIKFNGNNRLYYFAPGELELAKGTGVIVETSRGIEYGTVVMDIKEVGDDRIVQPLKQVLRTATPVPEVPPVWEVLICQPICVAGTWTLKVW